MQHLLINSSICLLVLWLVYKLLLENTSWHQFKRMYLLAAIVVSVVIPFMVVKTVVLPLPTIESNRPLPTFEQVSQVPMETVAVDNIFTIDWTSVIVAVYVIGLLIMLFRFVKNLNGLRLKSTDQLDSFQNYRLILRPKVVVPHSFWNTIYVNRKDYHAGKIPLEVLQHEKAHLDQKHSIDIFLIELLLVLAWFNPLIYVIKYSIKLNHEFLADQAVIAQEVDVKTYQETLLQYAAKSQNRTLANTFNFPIIKKRFTIMKTQTSQTAGLLRSLAILPVLALLVISCGKEVTQMEPKINHSTTNNNPNTTFGVSVDGYEPEGTVEYNGQFFKYEIQPDFSVELMTMDGQIIDLKSNRFDVTAYYEAEKEVNELLENEADLKNKLSSSKFKILDASTTYTVRDTVYKSIGLKGKSTELKIEDLKSKDFSKRTMVKFTEDGVLKFMILPDYSKGQVKIREQMYENLGKIIDSTNRGALKQVLKTSIDQTNQNKREYDYRMAFLRLADKQINPVTYKIDNKEVDKSEIEELIKKVNDVPFDLVTVNGNKIELAFYTGTEIKMSEELLGNLYSQLFKTIDSDKNQKVAYVRNTGYSIYTINGDRGYGTFIHEGIEYSYKMPNDLSIDLFHPNGIKLTDEEATKLKLVVTPIWDSKTEEAIIKKDPIVKKYFEDDNAVIFYPKGYTTDYEEMLNYDFGDTYIQKYIEHGKLKIQLAPYSYKKTNPSFIDFFKRDDI
ncbi:M56 family metallopeptidase [Nonlabens marinus]|uniref:Regulatory sensor-transducer, BlaR1/MecR1 family / TonB-dependent receptor n=1 Tax=Nonlabens marinus S1-08 TaxID=1454201 RepID=W8VPS0_9FLAO|nr:M56 family metallopeptidase [Nonlabens marinus]BAO55194.1 regulatory sensor-transducer, BlaR1/MecR1 family / TonB-dependent receptor [Nonlabens marinus S1-08]